MEPQGPLSVRVERVEERITLSLRNPDPRVDELLPALEALVLQEFPAPEPPKELAVGRMAPILDDVEMGGSPGGPTTQVASPEDGVPECESCKIALPLGSRKCGGYRRLLCPNCADEDECPVCRGLPTACEDCGDPVSNRSCPPCPGCGSHRCRKCSKETAYLACRLGNKPAALEDGGLTRPRVGRRLKTVPRR